MGASDHVLSEFIAKRLTKGGIVMAMRWGRSCFDLVHSLVYVKYEEMRHMGWHCK